MGFFQNAWGDITSIFSPSNEQKALNALNALLGALKTVDVVIDPILSLYAPLGAIANALDGFITLVQAGINDLQAVVAKQKGS